MKLSTQLGWLCFATAFTQFTVAHEHDEYSQWLKKSQQEFQQYIDEQDQAFADFLKQKWIDKDVEPERVRDETPKVEKIPTAPPVIVKTPTIKPEPKPLPKIDPPKPRVKPKPVPVKIPKSDQVEYEFFGHQVAIPKLKIKNYRISTLNSTTIGDTWIKLAGTKFKPVVKSLNFYGQKLNLDDWGQALLTNQYVQNLSLRSETERSALTWFLLVKQNFDARVAYSDRNLHLLLNVAQPLYGQTFFKLDRKRYYLVDLNQRRPVKVAKVWTYDKQHGKGQQPFFINLQRPAMPGPDFKERALTAKISGQKYTVPVRYSKDYVAMLDYYPQMDMVHYFRANLPKETRESLINGLKPQLEPLSEIERINFLLNFVQLSFEYQTDQQQFNYENYLFASETIHYPYADCEDRSVLFAWLVKNLLGNDVIGIQYEGHIATAVEVSSETDGKVFNVGGKQYVMADPTYINAKLGQAMPDYQSAKPTFIKF